MAVAWCELQDKKLTKEDIAGPNRVQTNHSTFNYGLDNKGVDTAKDADSPDLIKSQMYGYNYGASVPAAQVPNTYDQASTSNSNNGGSVNSQVNISISRACLVCGPPTLLIIGTRTHL